MNHLISSEIQVITNVDKETNRLTFSLQKIKANKGIPRTAWDVCRNTTTLLFHSSSVSKTKNQTPTPKTQIGI
jgi:hypothetical protein